MSTPSNLYPTYQQPSAPPLDTNYPGLYSPQQSVQATIPPTAPQTYPVYLTQEKHSKTNALLWQVAYIRDSILQKPDNPQPSQIPIHQDRPECCSSWHYFRPTHTIDFSDRSINIGSSKKNYNPNHSRLNQKNDDGTRFLIGVLGTITMFVTAYFMGKAMAEKNNNEFRSSYFNQLKNDWQNNQDLYFSEYKNCVNDTIQITDGILQRRQTQQIEKIALLVFAFMAGGTAVAGAIAASKILMLTGLGVGAFAGIVALYKWGFASASTLDQSDVMAINANIVYLKANEPNGLIKEYFL